MIKNISNLGDAALYCDFGNDVNKEINSNVIQFFKNIQKSKIPGVINITPSYNKLIISFDLNITNFDKIKTEVEQLSFKIEIANVGKLIKIPVCCDNDFALDIKRLEKLLKLEKEEIYKKKKDTVNILTHCNAGWLATIDWGTATSPIYHAHKKGIPVHVWTDETRPRNQGANLTSYELNEEGIKNTIIADNTGGILMQRGEVDMCIVGTDRTLANGDVCNKVGTYLKALAAHDNKIPFYVALPSSTIDWNIKDHKDIPIEERNSDELSHMEGLDEKGDIKKIQIYPKKSKAMNLAFDVTPAKYVTGLITEKGVCEASEKGLKELFK